MQESPIVSNKRILKKAKFKYLDLMTLSRGHRTTSTVWDSINTFFVIINSISSVIASASALAAFTELKTVIIVFSIISAILSSLLATLEPGKKATYHREAENSLEEWSQGFYSFFSRNIGELTATNNDLLNDELERLMNGWQKIKPKDSRDVNWIFIDFLDIFPNNPMVKFKRVRNFINSKQWEQEWETYDPYS